MGLIVVVEVGSDVRRALLAALDARHHCVFEAATGAAAIQLVQAVSPDLVVLDLELAGADGLELCRHLLILVRCPIIVISDNADEGRIVDALDLGVDDFIVKPVSVPVLMARVRVALRHRASTVTLIEEQVLEAGDLRIDVAAHQVMIAHDVIELQARQFAFLAILVRNQGKVVSYETFANGLGNRQPLQSDRNSWRVLVSKIRKILGSGPMRPTIVTEMNVGYRLMVPPHSGPST